MKSTGLESALPGSHAGETLPKSSAQLIAPYGGPFKKMLVDDITAAALKGQAANWPSWNLTPRQTCDLEILLNGGLNPLTGFMGKSDYERVCAGMHLMDGTLWPIPIVLDVSENFAKQIGVGTKIALRDEEGVALAILTVEDLWRPDRFAEAQNVYGTISKEHSGVRCLLESTGPVYIGGSVQGLELPQHHDFRNLRHTPEQLRTLLRKMGWGRVIGFQTRNPMHRAHYEMTLRASREHQANLLIHPVVGMTRPGDVDHFCRTRCYQALLPRYPDNQALLSLLPLSMRMGGPREAVWHAIIRRNYGCSHFIIGRDHAGPGSGNGGKAFYSPYAAQELAQKHAHELGMEMIPFQQMVYLPSRDQCVTTEEIRPGEVTLDLSGTELRQRLAAGREIPSWFTFPEVATELRKAFPPRCEQGFTVFFTGLSGSGKSTVAKALLDKLLETGTRPVTLLDGDVVRKHLSSELGFSREHRNLNIRRIGFVANEITKNGGIAICAPIAPYDSVRQEVRELISSRGGFILVYLSTPLEVCEQRDRKGLYAKARAGLIPEFTGISDPYEVPPSAEVVLNTAELTVEDACEAVLRYLRQAGYLRLPKGESTEDDAHWHGDGSPSSPLARDGLESRPGPLTQPKTLNLNASTHKWARSLRDKVSRGLWYLDFEDLCAEAMRRTGCDDFGSPSLTPALPVLLESLEHEAGLRPFGRFLMRMHVRDLLETRLRLAHAWSWNSKGIESQRVERPIFIVGMPRSGSTFLHELLGEDPENRAPRVWEVMYPMAATREEATARKQHIRKAETCLWWFRRLVPQADSVYPMRALTPHECVAIQSYTFLSEEFISTCQIPSYEAFLRAADLTPAYQWQKRFLQHLQSRPPEKRWVLKSPDHVHGLEALFSVFPDAHLIQTHRNPIEVLKSSADLTEALQSLYARSATPEEVMARETRTLAENTERFIQFRDNHPELADKIIDIKYSDFVADPLEAVHSIYARLKTPLNESHAERIRQLASSRSRYQGPRASAEPFRFKFNIGAELGLFERYCLRFGLPFQGAE